MKHFLLLFFFVITSATSFSQKVINPKNGILTNDFHFVTDSLFGSFRIDSTNVFYVVPFEGKTAHELYTDMVTRVAHMFEYPNAVMQTVEDKTVIINGFKGGVTNEEYTDSFMIERFGDNDRAKLRNIISIHYRLEFQFKDGRIRVNPPSISKFETVSLVSGYRGNYGRTYLKDIYKHDVRAIHKIEDYFNSTIPLFLYDIPTDDNW